jgi:hypothetical protein
MQNGEERERKNNNVKYNKEENKARRFHKRPMVDGVAGGVEEDK